MPHRKEPNVKMPIADANTRRGPKGLAPQPLVGMNTARLKVELARTAFMLNGGTLSACAIAGTAVFKMVVSKDSMKNPTATNQGSNRLAVAVSAMLSVSGKASPPLSAGERAVDDDLRLS